MDRTRNYAFDLDLNSTRLVKEFHSHGRVSFEDGSSSVNWRYPNPGELREWLKSNGNFMCELDLHTKTVLGHEAITFTGTSKRFFWAEFMTHRECGRNASSTRAIPYEKMKKWILNDPALPIHYGRNKPGMVSGSEIDDVDGCEADLLDMLEEVYRRMDLIYERYGLHKDFINRCSEPWSWIRWVVTYSRPGFHNMLNLRCNPGANPDYQRLAVTMARLYRKSVLSNSVTLLEPGQWHISMISDIHDWTTSPPSGSISDLKEKLIWSTARSAWTSYLTVEEKIATFEQAIKRHDDCIKLIHPTPLEHQCQATGDDSRSGPMIGYKQYRHMVPNESCSEFDFSILDGIYKDRDFVIS